MDILSYAKDLSSRHQYKESAEEYTRALYYFPALRQNADLFQSALRLAEASEDYPYAMQLSESLGGINNSLNITCLRTYYRGRLFYRMEKYDSAVSNLQLTGKCDKSIRYEASYFRMLAHMRMGEWDQADSEVQKLLANAQEVTLLEKAQATIADGRRQKTISPPLAATLSALVPGGGYAYSRQPKSALASFITTGLLSWGAVSAFHKSETGVGILLSLFGSGWYFGGVYGSARAAERYNQYRSDKLLSPLERY